MAIEDLLQSAGLTLCKRNHYWKKPAVRGYSLYVNWPNIMLSMDRQGMSVNRFDCQAIVYHGLLSQEDVIALRLAGAEFGDYADRS